MKIAVIGPPEDVAGFALAGVEEEERADETSALLIHLSDDCVVVIDADDR